MRNFDRQRQTFDIEGAYIASGPKPLKHNV